MKLFTCSGLPQGPVGLLVGEGRVSDWLGPTEINEWEGPREDFGNAQIRPAFIDPHCHILPTGLDLLKLHLGSCDTRQEVLDAVRNRLADVLPGEWLHAVHYDQNKFPDGVHLTRNELDSVAAGVPVLLRHSNGHASVANTAALKAAGIAENEPDPAGGTFVRDASGRLTGVLLERAHEFVTDQAPAPCLDQMVEAILRAGNAMACYGIATAADMMTGRWDLDTELQAYRLASENGCSIRSRLYAQWKPLLGPRALSQETLHERLAAMAPDRCRLSGAKIFADGAIGSATAAIYGRYENQPGEGDAGTLIYQPERLNQMVERAHEAGYTVAVHAIGDRAVDHVLDAFEATGEPSRHRIEHAMILSDDQAKRLAGTGCHCSMQPQFLSAFGHAYQRQLGPKRASKLKRMKTLLDLGTRLSLSSDRPIVSGHPWVALVNATSRPAGFDPSENIALDVAMDLHTRGGGDALNESDLGRLTVGSHADFQIVSGEMDGTVIATYVGGERAWQKV